LARRFVSSSSIFLFLQSDASSGVGPAPGADLPFVIIFAGVLGGMFAFGLIGL
jgi:hypothetical protein